MGFLILDANEWIESSENKPIILQCPSCCYMTAHFNTCDSIIFYTSQVVDKDVAIASTAL